MTGTGTDKLARIRAVLGSRSGSFGVALTLALVLHLTLILGLAFEMPQPSQRIPEVVTVQLLRQAAPNSLPPTDYALAQANRRGAEREAETEQTAGQAAAPDPDARGPETDPVAAEPTALPPKETPTAPPPHFPDPLPERLPAPVDVTQILASRGAEIARLTEQVRERSAAYASRPRRKAISASTREYKYANYLEAWRRKVEAIGNLNYPEVAKRRKLFGNLILQVSVRADGHVEDIQLRRSSGYPELDEAAIRIVKLAAPFAPFPPDIRAETDVLDITRTWQFLHGNRLGWDN